MKTHVFKALVVLLLGVMPYFGYADVPGTMSYQGYLLDASGKPIEGTADMTFSIPGTAWTETHTGMPVKQGVFGVLLGRKNSLASVDWSQPRLLRVEYNGTSQVMPLSSVPYAFHAKTVGGLLFDLGEVYIPEWYSDPVCKKVSFNIPFSRPPKVFLSLNHHHTSSSIHDPVTVWNEYVNTNEFRVCVNDTDDNHHVSVYVEWLAMGN
jgi:hypothetical protein